MQSFLKELHYSIVRSTERSKQHYMLLGLLGLFGFPAYYFIWNYIYIQPYENLTLRLIGSFLCLLLVLKNYWPKSLKAFLPIYWYLTLLYAIPFFFNFMLLKNDINLVWLISTFAGLFILILVVDWIWLFIIFITGAILAWYAYLLTGGSIHHLANYFGFVAIYLFVGIVGALFMYNTDRIQKSQLEAMAVLSGNVAHELRTPLLGLKSGITGLKRYMPMLYDTYNLAKEHQLPVPTIRRSHFNNMLPALERMDAETYYANTIIDMLLMNVGRGPINPESFELCSIGQCIDTALDRYPFDSAEEQAKIHFDKSKDFQFMGSPLLMEHIIFNLLKNALHFIVDNEQGEIYIGMKHGNKVNELHFKDTGQGIPPEVMPRLFERFFTTTLTGTGIGLSFCKLVMKQFHGNISCRSTYGEYTEFLLTFPKEDVPPRGKE